LEEIKEVKIKYMQINKKTKKYFLFKKKIFFDKYNKIRNTIPPKLIIISGIAGPKDIAIGRRENVKTIYLDSKLLIIESINLYILFQL
tara:strand:- start:81 stop:344 length:264 start_codon:yes stop_codon:yes gene_type:complete